MATKKTRMRATLQRVADHAGVSKATASMILSGRAGYLDLFNPDTVRKVYRSAETLHYRTNVFASSLGTAKTPFFALVINGVGYEALPWYYDAFEGLLFGGVVGVSAETGSYPIVLTVGADSSPERVEDVYGIISGGVFGTIARTPPQALEDKIHSNLDRHQPVVIVFPERHGKWASNTIDVDNAAIGRLAGEIFARNGRKTWAVVCFKSSPRAHEIREQAFEQVARRCGVTLHVIRLAADPLAHDLRHVVMPRLLKCSPDAVFGVNAAASVSSVLASGEMSLQPGKDVDIMGVDCAVWGDERLARCSISSLGVSWKLAGRVAMERLIELRNSGEYTFPHVLLRPNITPGQSCPVPPDLLDLNNQGSILSA